MTQKYSEPNILVVMPALDDCPQAMLLARMVLQQQDNLHVLLVDEQTNQASVLLESVSEQEDRIQVLHSPQRINYAAACKLGFEHALRNAYPYVLTMHADFSDNPGYIPQLAALARANELAVGSRFRSSGGTIGMQYITASLENQLNRTLNRVYKLPGYDCLNGFACYQTFILPHIHYKTLPRSEVYFLAQLLQRCLQSGFRIGELAVYRDARQFGRSGYGIWALLVGLLTAAASRFARPGNNHTIQPSDLNIA